MLASPPKRTSVQPDHPVLRLRQALRGLPTEGTVEIPYDAVGFTAFFPGGHGLWETRPGHALPGMPTEVMILGNNFSHQEYYHECLDGKRLDRNTETWGGLERLLASAGLGPEMCFYTNAYLDLIPGGGKMTKNTPGSKNPAFAAACRPFFVHQQLPAQRPKLVLALGKPAIAFVAEAIAGPASSWRNVKRSFAALDGPAGLGARPFAAKQPGIPHEIIFVALTHPSLPNARHRRYQSLAGVTLRGPEAEQWMLRDAMKMAGLPSRRATGGGPS